MDSFEVSWSAFYQFGLILQNPTKEWAFTQSVVYSLRKMMKYVVQLQPLNKLRDWRSLSPIRAFISQFLNGFSSILRLRVSQEHLWILSGPLHEYHFLFTIRLPGPTAHNADSLGRGGT